MRERLRRFLVEWRIGAAEADVARGRRPSAAPPARPSWRATGRRSSCSTRPAATRCGPSARPADEGRVALAASSATHAVLPLLATREGLRLQLDAGIRSHRRRFGWDGGFWLPECAYAPGLEWRLAEHGVRWFCVDQSAHGDAARRAHPGRHRGRPGGAADRLGGGQLALVARRLPLRPRPRPVRRQIAARDPDLEGRRRRLRPGGRGRGGAAPGARVPRRRRRPAARLRRRARRAAACSSSRSTPSCSATGGRRGRSGSRRCSPAPRRPGCGCSPCREALAEHEPVARPLARLDLGRGQGPAHLGLAGGRRPRLGRAAARAAPAAGALAGLPRRRRRPAPRASCSPSRRATGPSSTGGARPATTPSSAPPPTRKRPSRP